MISEDDFAAAAGVSDPNMAFVRLETRFRKVLEGNLEASQNNYSYGAAIGEYMNHTLAAAQFFKLDFLDFFEVPDPNDETISDTYRHFMTLVDAFKVRVQLEYVRSPIEFSVGLSNSDKEKLRFYVAQMKPIIDAANLTEQKRDALHDKLNKFLEEVDRNRAPWTRFGDIVISMANVGGEAFEKLEPARKWIDSIAKLLGHNKEIENSQPKLPKPTQKKIEDQRPRSTTPTTRAVKTRGDMDDEIPF